MKWMVSVVIILVLSGVGVSFANSDVQGSNLINSNLSQATSVIGGGDSSSSSNAQGGVGYSTSYLSLNTTSNYQGRTAPLPTSLPYLPLWNHGGWGTVKGYFANGPTATNSVYERMINPDDPKDIKQLHKILGSVPYTNVFQVIPGLLNGIATVFGAPDEFHHGRGFEITNTVIRKRRPDGKHLMIYIDTNVDKSVLQKVGYAYMGKISVEGLDTQSWDQVYSAAIAEVLPWDVDMILISGGMKGVTVGQNVSFPSAAFGYSQTNYSLSLTGGMAKGVTEGKGKPVLSAEAYRYCPEILNREALPREFYQSLKLRAKQEDMLRQQRARMMQERREQYQRWQAYHRMQPSQGSGPCRPTSSSLQPCGGNPQGVNVNPELYDMAGFNQGQQMDYLNSTQVR